MQTVRCQRAFTLIEVLMVVVILGMIASLVVIMVQGASGDAQRLAFVKSGQSIVGAAERYRLTTGQVVPDGSSGVQPNHQTKRSYHRRS